MAADQQITAEYCDFHGIVVKMFNQIQKGQVTASMVLDNFSETAMLNFQQESEFRTVDLLSIKLSESDVETIKNSISFRINLQSQLNMLVQERLKDITRIIEQKNPALLKEIKKGTEQAIHSQGQKIDIN